MSLGRPREFNPDLALDAAMQLFWRQGYDGTSLQQLLDGMRLSKSSLYQAFGNKHQLFIQCINRYHALTMLEMEERLLRLNNGRQFIEETLHNVISEDNDPRGCLVTNTATEFAQSDPQIAAQVSNGLNGYRSMFESAVQKGQSDGSINSDRPPQLLAHYLVTSMSGLRTMVKAGTDEKILIDTVQIITDSLH